MRPGCTPDAIVTVGEEERTLEPSTRHELDVELPEETPVWIRGRVECAPRYRIAMTADIQTNPRQFERIVERLQDEARAARAAGEPLMGLVLAGDLTEASRDDEFRTVLAILIGFLLGTLARAAVGAGTPLAPFEPSDDRIRDGGPPLVQEWTKWVIGPGERGEPAGTTSGSGPSCSSRQPAAWPSSPPPTRAT